MYILYKSYMKPVKGQLPDVVYEYLKDDTQFPYHAMWTKSRDDALEFDDREEAEWYAELYGMSIKKI